MKRLLKAALCAVIFICLLTVCVCAEEAGGLTAFDTIASMTNYTFNDLVSNHWAFSGIKICYDRGILIGFPDGTFCAEENVTWSQAVTIAARIHSVYHDLPLSDIKDENDLWFKPYYDYCVLNKLLPTGGPAYELYDDTDINRYDLAYIFSRLISSGDMPAISDRSVPDASVIPSKYLSSVKTMYAAGIMNGMDKNAFNGTSFATRAQVAEVVARLLVPAEREGYDSRVNLDMQPYEANLENDSIAVSVGKEFFCIYKTYVTTTAERYALYKNDTVTGRFSPIYTCDVGDYMANLSVYNGKVYFTVSTSGTASGLLICYDPDTEKFSTVYAGNIVESYCFYNSQIYALLFSNYSETVDGYTYDFGTISKTGFTPIHSGYSYYEAMYFTPYGWNGCIYFRLSSKDGPTYLYKYSIADKRISRVMNANINSAFFDGHVMYFLAYNEDGSYDRNLYSVSVQTPEVVTSIGAFPAPTDSKFRSIYKCNDEYYCLSAFSRDVYSMSETGSSRIALITGGIYNAMCFTADKVIIIPNTLVTSNANEMFIYNSRTLSAKEQLGDWLGLSCYYEGRHFIPDEKQTVLASSTSVSSVTDLEITISEAYMRGNDFIVLAKYTNKTGEKIKLRSYVVQVGLNNAVFVAQDVNRMSGYEMKKDDIQTFTFVIGENSLLQPIDLLTDSIGIRVIPTYDIVQSTQK